MILVFEQTKQSDQGLHCLPFGCNTLFGDVRPKPACSATKASLSPKILGIASIGIIQSREQIIKMLIRLGGSAG